MSPRRNASTANRKGINNMGIKSFIRSVKYEITGTPPVSGDQWWAAANKRTDEKVAVEMAAYAAQVQRTDELEQAAWMAKQKPAQVAVAASQRRTSRRDEEGTMATQTRQIPTPKGCGLVNG